MTLSGFAGREFLPLVVHLVPLVHLVYLVELVPLFRRVSFDGVGAFVKLAKNETDEIDQIDELDGYPTASASRSWTTVFTQKV